MSKYTRDSSCSVPDAGEDVCFMPSNIVSQGDKSLLRAYASQLIDEFMNQPPLLSGLRYTSVFVE